jgi:hypothetical protein
MKFFRWDEKTPDDLIAMSSHWRSGCKRLSGDPVLISWPL